MIDDLKRIESKVDIISDKISSIDSTLAAQHVSLSDHIRRTEILETAIIPLTKHDAMMQGVLKGIGILALAGTVTEALVALLQFIRHV